MTTTTTTS